ncbi:hypothetical protein D1871_11050 [Nakamurella silvestris]|nr:hypothetical protein D1871_11050 [Nakamurella silvestris]
MTTPATADQLPNTAEIGQPGNIRRSYSSTGAAHWQPAQPDPNHDLHFPRSVRKFDEMYTTDGKIGSIYRACTLPILRAGVTLDTEGIRPEVEDLVRANLGLPKPGAPQKSRRRGQAGIVWSEHHKEALLSLIYGFMPFEQVYTVTMPGDPNHPAGIDRPVVHLRKLGQRLPATLTGIRVGRDGGLLGITQAPPSGDVQWASGSTSLFDEVFIPVDRLVMYVNDREGANWFGRSMLRQAYKHWLLRDDAIRTAAAALERQAMGLPVVTYDGIELSREDALEIARDARSGRTAGIAFKGTATGTTGRIELIGVTGGTVDPLPQIAYHEQAMSQSVLAMVLDLGHDAGARNLADNFVDLLEQSLKTIAANIAAVATEHIVRDLVELNFGPDEPYPTLMAGEVSMETALTPEQLAVLAKEGVLLADSSLRSHLRDRWNLPVESGETPAATSEPATPAPAAEPSVSLNGEAAYRANLAARLANLAAARQ